MNKKIASALMFVLVLMTALAGCSSQTKSNGKTLKVGVVKNLNNFSYYNPVTKQYSGVAMDLANEIAGRTDYGNVEFVPIDVATREQSLANGDVDCIITTMTITDERKKTIDFSTTYYQDKFVMLVENSTGFTKTDDLKGKTIGTMESDAMKKMVTDLLGEGNVTFVTDSDFAVLDKKLETGEVDAVFLDGCVANAIKSDERQILYESENINDYGVATKKDSDISKTIDDAVKAVVDDGTMAKIIEKWN